MKITRRNFFKKTLAGTLLLGAGMLPQPLAAFTTAQPKRGRQKAKRVVLISLDGISVAGFRQANTPRLDELLAQGVLSLQTRVVMPSVTLPNWTSHLTGSGPEQHGVVNNNWTLADFKLPAVTTDSDGYYPSVFTLLKEKNPNIKTAFYYNWLNLIYPYNRKYLDEVSFLEEDAYIPNYEKAFNFLVENRNSPTMAV
ncbi:alkaline phosphatase family protein [Bacteroides fluxus]|uniref:Tat pathway signal sequence domain protein n=1 Tax=Bacteroides fluxus YIT 12057 TaxID=763034 RepID=F3PYF3_9BACE|nr:Tat pathway signal sequence domain protein [Bacteroides fluxus YIT 12057]